MPRPAIQPRSNINASKSGPIAQTYEPMRHKRPSVERPCAVEQVRLVEEIRLQKDHVQRAFSDEKMRNMELIDRQKGKDMHIS